MEHARKMVLVPEAKLNEKISSEKNEECAKNRTCLTTGTVLTRLDNEMYEILNSFGKYNTDREKCQAYLQVLERYLRFLEYERKHVIGSNIEENVVQQESSFENSSQMLDTSAGSDESLNPHHSSYEVIIDNSIIESVPKKLRSNCARVLKRLRKAPTALISWDDRGCVTIKGRKIPHSNITDLVNDIIRPRKQAKAIGRQQFAKVLQTLNIPREFIGNRAYFNNVSEEEEELSTSTPTRRRSANSTIPEIITENVTVNESMLNQSGNGTLNKSKKISWIRLK